MIDVTQRVKDKSDYKYIYFYTQSRHMWYNLSQQPSDYPAPVLSQFIMNDILVNF